LDDNIIRGEKNPKRILINFTQDNDIKSHGRERSA